MCALLTEVHSKNKNIAVFSESSNHTEKGLKSKTATESGLYSINFTDDEIITPPQKTVKRKRRRLSKDAYYNERFGEGNWHRVTREEFIIGMQYAQEMRRLEGVATDDFNDNY